MRNYTLFFFYGTAMLIMAGLIFPIAIWHLSNRIEILETKIDAMETNRLSAQNYLNRADDVLNTVVILDALNTSGNKEVAYNYALDFDAKAVGQLYFSAYQKGPDKSILKLWKSSNTKELQELYSFYFDKWAERNNALVQDKGQLKTWLTLSNILYPLANAIGLVLIFISDFHVRKRELEE